MIIDLATTSRRALIARPPPLGEGASLAQTGPRRLRISRMRSGRIRSARGRHRFWQIGRVRDSRKKRSATVVENKLRQASSTAEMGTCRHHPQRGRERLSAAHCEARAKLPHSRRGPRGVSSERAPSERGMVRAARATGRERHSRVVRLMPDSASRGGLGAGECRRRSAMSAPARPRTSRWYHDPFVRWTCGFPDSAT
jgi:hypothetical protein